MGFFCWRFLVVRYTCFSDRTRILYTKKVRYGLLLCSQTAQHQKRPSAPATRMQASMRSSSPHTSITQRSRTVQPPSGIPSLIHWICRLLKPASLTANRNQLSRLLTWSLMSLVSLAVVTMTLVWPSRNTVAA